MAGKTAGQLRVSLCASLCCVCVRVILLDGTECVIVQSPRNRLIEIVIDLSLCDALDTQTQNLIGLREERSRHRSGAAAAAAERSASDRPRVASLGWGEGARCMRLSFVIAVMHGACGSGAWRWLVVVVVPLRAARPPAHRNPRSRPPLCCASCVVRFDSPPVAFHLSGRPSSPACVVLTHLVPSE